LSSQGLHPPRPPSKPSRVTTPVDPLNHPLPSPQLSPGSSRVATNHSPLLSPQNQDMPPTPDVQRRARSVRAPNDDRTRSRPSPSREGSGASGGGGNFLNMNGGSMPGTPDDRDVLARTSRFFNVPTSSVKSPTIVVPPSNLADRLQPTLDQAVTALSSARIKSRVTTWSVNVAIGVQVLLGALTTGIAAATSGRQTSVVISILGGLSTLAASFLASARGTGEPEKSTNRSKELKNFIRDLSAYMLDKGHHGPDDDERVTEYRRRFEEIMGHDPAGKPPGVAKHITHPMAVSPTAAPHLAAPHHGYQLHLPMNGYVTHPV